jgi:hypothetical protein
MTSLFGPSPGHGRRFPIFGPSAAAQAAAVAMRLLPQPKPFPVVFLAEQREAAERMGRNAELIANAWRPSVAPPILFTSRKEA